MANPHSFTSGTEKALFRMAAGTCYFPKCDTPIITEVNDTPIVGVEIAHIRGAEPGAARYEPGMTDEERRAFSNLILLCTLHHKYVDRLAAAEHPVEVLEEWKRENEPSEGLGVLAPRLTEETLLSLLEEVATLRPRVRGVEVELRGGVMTLPSGVSTVPLPDLPVVLAHNAHLANLARVLVIEVRNIGTLPITVESVDIEAALKVSGQEELSVGALLGRNDMPMVNPVLPRRIEDSAASQWYQSVESMKFFLVQEQMEIFHVRAVVRLASGERVETPWVPWPAGLEQHIPKAPTKSAGTDRTGGISPCHK
jgi:hypothetical protein